MITENNVWEYICASKKINFPKDVLEDYTLLAEFISEGEPGFQYRVYSDNVGNGFYAKVPLRVL